MENDKKWFKSISNWIIIIACVILIPILIMNVYIMIQSKRNVDEIPSVFGIKPFIVLSGSMETEIYKGDLILTKIVDPETLKEEDVIAFRDAQNTVTTHRIIDIVDKGGKTYFITKGDNNDTQDQYLVEFESVEGIYLFRIPGVGSMMNSLAQPTTVLILVLGITIIFVIGFVISNKKQKEIEMQEFLEYKRQKEIEEKAKAKEKEEKTKEKRQAKKNSSSDDTKKEVRKQAKKAVSKRNISKSK